MGIIYPLTAKMTLAIGKLVEPLKMATRYTPVLLFIPDLLIFLAAFPFHTV